MMNQDLGGRTIRDATGQASMGERHRSPILDSRETLVAAGISLLGYLLSSSFPQSFCLLKSRMYPLVDQSRTAVHCTVYYVVYLLCEDGNFLLLSSCKAGGTCNPWTSTHTSSSIPARASTTNDKTLLFSIMASCQNLWSPRRCVDYCGCPT